jgi:gluconate 5-dehydrogenase
MKRTVIVTGATGYFGRHLVRELAKDHHVIATARSAEKLAQVCDGLDATPLALDLYDVERIGETITGACANRAVHGLVNNAYDFSQKTGFNTPAGRFEDMSVDAMRAGLESGVLAQLVITQAVGRRMIDEGIKGSIVNISSMYGTVAPDYRLYEGKSTFNPITYGVAKAALNAMTRYIASFWGPHGIRCNAVAPGSFPNRDPSSYNATQDAEFLARLERKTTLGRVGEPRDLTGIIRLLLSDESAYITGQVIGVDGGWTIT